VELYWGGPLTPDPPPQAHTGLVHGVLLPSRHITVHDAIYLLGLGMLLRSVDYILGQARLAAQSVKDRDTRGGGWSGAAPPGRRKM
jgi:hypothetical protein